MVTQGPAAHRVRPILGVKGPQGVKGAAKGRQGLTAHKDPSRERRLAQEREHSAFNGGSLVPYTPDILNST